MTLSTRVATSLKQTLLYCCLLIVLLFLIFPVYYMVITSLKPPGEAYRLPPTLWPEHPTVSAYPFMFEAWVTGKL
jgi:ABC-type glycerol-3-phosphate transport system permease component